MIDYTLTKVMSVLKENNLCALKQLGQNFLIDKNILKKIVATLPKEPSNVIEIGPGLGGLTHLLMENRRVLCYEIDKGLFEILSREYAGCDNVKIILGDALKADFSGDAQDFFGTNQVSICANLPYYITTPLIMKFLESSLDIAHMTLMMQKEVALRLAKKNYGAITLAVDYFCDTKILFEVSKNCFYPAPSVSSAVVGFSPKDYDALHTKQYLDTVKILFASRRKTIKNNLLGHFTEEKINEVLQSLDLLPNLRCEQLSPAHVKSLALALFQE